MEVLESGLATTPPSLSEPVLDRGYLSTSLAESPRHATVINSNMKLTAPIV